MQRAAQKREGTDVLLGYQLAKGRVMVSLLYKYLHTNIEGI